MSLTEQQKQIAWKACGLTSRYGVSIEDVYAAVEAVLADSEAANRDAMTAALAVANDAWEKAIRNTWPVGHNVVDNFLAAVRARLTKGAA